MQKFAVAAVSIGCALLGASAAYAQRGLGDWTTGGFDAQRSHWLRNDAKISTDSMRKPGFELEWKLNLNDPPRRQSFLTPPALFDFYIGYRGFRSLGFVGNSANTVTGIDTDLARIEWKRDFDIRPPAGASILCPGGMTSGVTRPTSIGYPPIRGGAGAGRGNPAKSDVGAPFEGAVTLKRVPPPRPVPVPAPAGSAASTTRRVSAPPNPFAARAQYVHALTSDGRFHSLYVSNGEEPQPAVQFLPPNAYAQGLIVFDGMAYVSTTNSCGGGENGVWALDLESKKVSHWKSEGSGVAGSAGPVAGPDGTVYVSAGGELVALEERTLKPKASYTIGGQQFTSSPVVFDFKGKDLIAATANDGRLHLMDAAALSTPLAKTASFSSADFATGALASWQDPAGTRWILVPAAGATASGAGFRTTNGDVKNGAIVAWKVVEQNGAPTLQPGWVSRDMTSPLTPIVVNGVIFAVSTGEFRPGDPKVTDADRSRRSFPAILYALDAIDGKELWNSGSTISTFVTRGGMAAGGSRVYIASQDGTQYTFGFPIEH